jgi:cephalosporin hydroxylase
MRFREHIKSRLTKDQRRHIRRAINVFETACPPLRSIRQALVKLNWPELPGGRSWRTAIPPVLLHSLVEGAISYRYRDIPMQKHPIEIALYMRLLWEIRPATIIEIGALEGGAAVWMGDLLDTFGIDGRVISIDLRPPNPSYAPSNVKFLYGDANNLEATVGSDFFLSLPRPWLIIEDASHDYVTTLKVLRFFDPLLHSGEYMIVEDAAVPEIGQDSWHEGGAGRAIAQFMRCRGSDYEIETRYCDYYGRNVTGNPNGYLRKK